MFAPEQPMKTVFITYNQAYHEIIVRLLTKMSLRGYTSFERAQGRGSKTGEPHIGDHAWPTMNSAMYVIAPETRVPELLERCVRWTKRRLIKGFVPSSGPLKR